MSSAGASYLTGGNLGVGTASPGSPLTVAGGSSSLATVELTNTGGDGVIMEAKDGGGSFFRLREGNGLGVRGQAIIQGLRRLDSATALRLQGFSGDGTTNSEAVVGFHASLIAQSDGTLSNTGAVTSFTGDTSTKRFYGCDGAQMVALAAPGRSAGSDIPGTSVASAAQSCVEIRDGGGLASGQYWIDPTGGDHWDAFLGYCDHVGTTTSAPTPTAHPAGRSLTTHGARMCIRALSRRRSPARRRTAAPTPASTASPAS